MSTDICLYTNISQIKNLYFMKLLLELDQNLFYWAQRKHRLQIIYQPWLQERKTSDLDFTQDNYSKVE